MSIDSSSTARNRILVVDDDSGIRSMVRDWLSECYDVTTAENGLMALEILRTQAFDLVISDINMPGMGGFDTLRRVREQYPGTRRALITDYDVDTYIKMALEEDITNIIVKRSPFDVEELFRTVDGLLTGQRIFGLQNYLQAGTPIALRRISSSEEIQSVREEGLSLIAGTDLAERNGNNIRLIFEEIASNAVYHAYGYRKFDQVRLREDERIEVAFGLDPEKFGFSVADWSGKLTKDVVLHKLLRAMSLEGVLDTSGRGLFLSRTFSDRFIINIRPGKQTEVVVLNYFFTAAENKPLYINVV
ncbi:MAG: response regulator [Candidatus Wallbacteria bacterium]|nr:response regulator [Candidatus Wallbacteria bacterium]